MMCKDQYGASKPRPGSLMYIRRRNGLIIKPWGTPLPIFLQPLEHPVTTAPCFMSLSQFHIRHDTIPFIPWAIRFHTLDSTSRVLQSVKLSVSYSEMSNNFVKHSFSFWNPRWLSLLNEHVSKWLLNSPITAMIINRLVVAEIFFPKFDIVDMNIWI